MSNLKKELNIEQKKLFRKWLIDAIEKNDGILFKDAVEIIGKEWHVLRFNRKNFNNFVGELWANIDDIKTGKYCLWSSTFSWKDKNGKEKHAHSYESKICFLINPITYKLIYDDNNEAQLKKVEELKKIITEGINEENWQKVADAYYDNKLYDDRFKDKIKLSINDYFEIDCDLWAKGN